MSNIINRSVVIRFVICSSVLACLLGAYCYFEYMKIRVSKLNQLLAERSELVELGAPSKNVEEILSDIPGFTIRDWRALEDVGRDIHELRVYTPLLFGAKNWVLIIYAEAEKVVALGFRTEDSDYEIPAGAPKDRFTQFAGAIWRPRMSLVPVPPE